jgi:hypothetical protein
MKPTAKIATVLVCIVLCGAGLVASIAHEKIEPRKPSVIPVKNPEIMRPIWLWA